jgi:Sulfotransferase family
MSSMMLLGAADRLADALGLLRRTWCAEELMSHAQRRNRLFDFGDSSFEEALRRLLRSYDEEANLSAFGQIAARWDVLRFLSNLLILREAEKKNPAILNQSIERPIFITGLPRSGTSFLHNLLSQDRANQVVRCWETIYPYPLHRRMQQPDVRRDKVDRQLASFARLAPEIRSLHPLDATSPQECTEITGHVFRSLRFDTTHVVPSYQRWLDETGHLAAYRFHKRFLQHLQDQRGPGRWILKCPDHVFALEALRRVYPDARFVFMHRDPVDVLPSVARLTEILRRPFTRSVDRLRIGRQVSDRWAEGAMKMIEAGDSFRTTPDRVFHFKFAAFVRDPRAGMAALYRHFGLAYGGELDGHVERFVAARPNGGYGRHRYRLDDYGLDAQVERRRYGDYVTYFGL